MTTEQSPRVIAYVRCSTEEQGASGLGLDAQRDQIEAEAERRGWARIGMVTEVASGKNLTGRPLLAEALVQLDAGEADVLVVAKVDRLGRSLLDLMTLAERAERRGWALVVLDCQVDTTTAAGRFVLSALGAVGELERNLISERTRRALAVKKARGARLGRPVALPAELRARIAAEHEAGGSLAGIARTLTAEGVPTAQGGARWHASTVKAVLASLEADRAAELAGAGA